MQLLSGVISSTSASFDDSDHSFLSTELSSINEKAQQKLNNLKLSETVVKVPLNFPAEKPSTSSSISTPSSLMDDEIATGVVTKVSGSASSLLAQEIANWSSYCNTMITKQTIKGCF